MRDIKSFFMISDMTPDIFEPYNGYVLFCFFFSFFFKHFLWQTLFMSLAIYKLTDFFLFFFKMSKEFERATDQSILVIVI